MIEYQHIEEGDGSTFKPLTRLHAASVNCHGDCIRALVMRGADVTVQNKEGIIISSVL